MEDWTTRPNWILRKKSVRAKAVIRKLGYQVLDTPENNFIFAILRQAILDAYSEIKDEKKAKDKKLARDSALMYLQSDMVHAQLVGLNPEYVRSVLVRANLMPSK